MDQSVMLAGIYTILSLQNPLNILSTTLYPSSRPIPVFGPSSHPNPVINPSTSRRRATPSGYLRRLPLPTTFNVGENRTIFLIREHECGFQGLRNGVVPGFSNIWGEHRGLMNLKGIHLVCCPTSSRCKLISRFRETAQQSTTPTFNLNHGPNPSNPWHRIQ
jgi:polynucleotide 5'-hydroxyl-kinase GRC3/NOL9